MAIDKKTISFFVLIFIAGFSCGYFLFPKTGEPAECVNSFPLINQFVACDLEAEKKLDSIKRLEEELIDYLDISKAEKNITRASVFFRDLSSKKWIGIDQNKKYSPASLLKLPLLIAYFELSESDSGLFSRKYVFKKIDPILHQNLRPEVELEEGKEYAIEELLKNMIIYSDNDAMNFLLEIIDENFIIEQYYQMGIDLDSNDEDYLSAISYSNILRILYNSSYLKRDSSQKILEWLAESEFKDGIVAGVPLGTDVAHKFGEREIDESKKELHDCGIVYYPDHPYILCIMTEGNDYKKLEQTIAGISRLIYQGVKKLDKD